MRLLSLNLRGLRSIITKMPVTRSASRSTTVNTTPVEVDSSKTAKSPATNKRKATTASTPKNTPKAKKARVDEAPPSTPLVLPPVPEASESDDPIERSLVPAVLSFSFEDAKRHLINVDGRFEDIFSKLRCKPYDQLEQVHPFRALVQSILGQQISWLAARSINHKFIRLYNPSLPEKATDYNEAKSATSFFPSPSRVAKTDVAVLKSAGLSTRKAEYVQDLAARFSDGRLSTEKLLEADDEELTQMLTEVRGIGKWTVDMFAMFSLRRPNILPVGDLGVQRGVLRWVLALHSPSNPFILSPEKLSTNDASEKEKDTKVTAPADPDALPTFGSSTNQVISDESPEGPALDISSVPPAPVSESPVKLSTGDNSNGGPSFSANIPSLPPLFTPSISKTLNDVQKATSHASALMPLPEGLTVAELKTRLGGKKKIKGALLTPNEMEALTETWKPYRSLGVYYMWSLAEDK